MSDLDNALDALLRIEVAAVANSDAVRGSAYAQEQPQYWTNRIAGWTTELESEELQIITYLVEATLTAAFLTEGFGEEAEKRAQTLIPDVLLYIGKRRKLRRTASDPDVPYLDPRGVINRDGQIIYENRSGIGAQMVSILFTFEMPMYQRVTQII